MVGLGLQSADDEIRKVCIRTPLSKEMFLQAHKIIHEFGYSTKCYILLKPPFLLQKEAIEDTVNSAIWLQEQGVEDITICPIRIANGTVLKDLFDKKLYAQPKLASLVECLRQLREKKFMPECLFPVRIVMSWKLLCHQDANFLRKKYFAA